MATEKTKTTQTDTDKAAQLIEERKLKALEKIANSLDALTLWFEEIDKDEWGPRIQWYLSEFHKLVPSEEEEEKTPNA
jgi:hypothetical protein